VGLVVMTQGPDGAIGRTRSARAAVAGHRIDIVDAVGAGDTVTGTLLAQLSGKGLTDKSAISELSETEIAELLTFSMGAAAVNCTRAGCNPPTPEETRAFLGL
ncbi:MAG: PfkB family carbohydrate kinase, partial [Pseudomonadota bacterium]